MDVTIVEIGGTVGDIESLAVSGSHPADFPTTCGTATTRSRAPDPGAGYIERRMASLKPNATRHSVNKLREIGDSAEHPAIAARIATSTRAQCEDRHVFLQRGRGRGHHGYGVETIYEVPIVFPQGGPDELIVHGS